MMDHGTGSNVVSVPVTRLTSGQDLPLPSYATPGAAGLDLMAAIPAESPLTLAPGGRALVPTGIALALSVGFEAQVRPRSGLALRHGVTVLNTPGTIDSDYRGEVGVILINLSDQSFVIERGQRIAQLIIAPVMHVTWAETGGLPASARGAGGFGSTGGHSQDSR